MNARRIAGLLVSCVLTLPTAAWAQAETGNIAGTVRDSSGAVMPGVMVEASSPVLIESFVPPLLTARASIGSSICDPDCTSSRSRCLASAPSNGKASSSPPDSRRR
jgi:hypothetical protein